MVDQAVAVAVPDASLRLAEAPPRADAAAGPYRTARIVQNVLALLSGQVLTWLATSIIVFALPRYLGDANLGKLTFAWGFTSVFGAFIGFGTPIWLTRAIAREPERAPHLAFNALVARLPIIVVAFAASTVMLQALGYPASTRVVVYIAMAWTSASACSSIVAASLQGLERMTVLSMMGVVEKVLIVIFGVGSLAFLGAGLDVWALVVFGAGVVSMLVLTGYFWRVAGLSTRIDLPLWRTLFMGSAPFLAWGIATTIYGGIDVTMLSLFSNDHVVGWYGAAYRFVGIPAFIPFALTTALLPSLSRAIDTRSDRAAGRALEIAVLLTLPIALFLLVGAAPTIHFFRYAPAFDHSIVLLQILSLHVPLVAISMIAVTVLIARNREKAWLVVSVGAAILNPLLNLVAIPYFQHLNGNGAVGAAITTVITEASVVAGAFWLLRKDTFGWANALVCARGLAAGVPMVLAMWLATPYGLIPIIAAGGLSYGVAALAFGAVRISELRELPGLIRAKGGAVA
ncbi:MAG: flippase [Chloroflexota bacterium]|nr:flippase [Chloroflexota bacterium]